MENKNIKVLLAEDDKNLGSILKNYLEAKGYFRAEDRVKLLSVRDNYPDMDLRLVFQKDNKVHRTSKMKYSDWAEKHGFQYCVGSIPKDTYH